MRKTVVSQRGFVGLLGVVALAASLLGGCRPEARFDGRRAYGDVLAQCELGPRLPGSTASGRAGEYIAQGLRRAGWAVEYQEFTYQGVQLRNIIGRRGRGPLLILGAHYDSRAKADRDPDGRGAPVPGANDGASGAAVLLELARTLEASKLDHEVWLAFFDAEDQGELDGWPWSVGAGHLAASLTRQPESVIVVDMVGDADQQLYWERSSTPQLAERVWAVAGRLGYGRWFVPEYRHSVIDDHTPFLERGIPALDIIDFDYPYWHTTADTADKVSPASLERVGRALECLLEGCSQAPGKVP